MVQLTFWCPKIKELYRTLKKGKEKKEITIEPPPTPPREDSTCLPDTVALLSYFAKVTLIRLKINLIMVEPQMFRVLKKKVFIANLFVESALY